MVGRGKSKPGRSKRSSRRMKFKINQLPDGLLCKILSHLPIEEAVTTSVLSTKWRSLWLLVPSLELNSRNFEDLGTFLSFGNMFFDPSRVSCIDKLTLTIGNNYNKSDDESYIRTWIDAVLKRKIQHLDIHSFKDEYFDENPLANNPLRLYSCETLVFLRLFGVILDDAVFVFLPCLKTMFLERNEFPDEATLKRLISSCPVLENLKVVASDTDTKVYRVHSKSLNRLTIERRNFIRNGCSSSVFIDAPLLRCLTIDDHQSESFIVNNMETNAKLNISIYFGLRASGLESRISSRRSSTLDFLRGISRAGNIRICQITFKYICQCLELEPLPQFGYLSKLFVSLYASNLKYLDRFLQSCPNLKSLVLVMQFDFDYKKQHFEEMNQISLPSVPESLLLSLEFVDFKLSIYGQAEAESMKLIRYFLENFPVLKKFTLRLPYHSTKDKISKEVYKIPTRSTNCEVVIQSVEGKYM